MIQNKRDKLEHETKDTNQTKIYCVDLDYYRIFPHYSAMLARESHIKPVLEGFFMLNSAEHEISTAHKSKMLKC